MRIRHLMGSVALIAAMGVSAAQAQEVAAPATPQGVALHEAAAQLVRGSNAERLEVLKSQLTAAGLPYTLHNFEGGNPRTGPMAGTNIVITLGEGDKDIVLVAHYDAAVLRDGAFSHGVVDNAGGTLAIIAAAKALPVSTMKHRVVMVLTDQEELGLIGARKWLEQADKERIAAAVNVDVAAYGTTVMFGLNNGPASTGLVRTLRTHCADTNTDCVAFPVYPPSEDRVFTAAGVPVLSLGIQNPIGARQMWLAFNGGQDNGLREGFVPDVFQNIHTHEDKMDKLKADEVVAFADFVAKLVLRIDSERP